MENTPGSHTPHTPRSGVWNGDLGARGVPGSFEVEGKVKEPWGKLGPMTP
ncbi:hypothetical protein ACVWW1_000059 [Bradyrhizobium sp. JR3.5]